ncbi:diguanylate cyclase [Azospirillum brasilense]|uniref:Diguanylate cyclase n=1 Tax=Azospirillum brasilense TaxID=192 RepID=A0A4D8QUC6_AZOBR|nr:diguanylate cyclase [Azospirillum brasilense]QCO14675.1 diguanylate cyclase [Azospirillum brasilense]
MATHHPSGPDGAPPEHDDGLTPSLAPSSTQSIDESFKERARQILAHSQTVTAGSVHLIGLDEIRNELGDRWGSVNERVHVYTERMLKKVLSPRDVWFRYGENHYIIVFAQADRKSAQLTCSKVMESLHQALLGHADTRRITVKTAVVDVGGGVALDTARLADLLKDAVHKREAPAAPSPPADGAIPATIPTAEARHPHWTEMPADTITPQSRPKVLFRPVFDVKHKVVSTYCCRTDADTSRTLNLMDAFDPEREEAVFDLDMETLSLAVSTYNELYANKFRYAQTIPVHFGTLASSRRRREYIQACRMIPRVLMPFLAFELDGLPAGVPYGRLAEIVAMLRPFARAAMVILHEDAGDLSVYATAGVKGVGLRLDGREDEPRILERVQTFCPGPRKFGMFAYVDGVRNPVELEAAEAAGAAYLSGPIIGEDSEVPEHMKRCTERQLLQRSRRRRHDTPWG